MDIAPLLKKNKTSFESYTVLIRDAKDDQLSALSLEMGLALALAEMKRIQQYFIEKKRDPSDIELQALGQAWSEHCCYKSSKLPLKTHIYGIEEDKIIAREDAGVIEFDKDHYYCAALESHNHPSAVEPYGGAATGVGGIVRDIVCMGAQPIAYVDPLFFGPIDMDAKDVPKGVKHPRYLFQGVVDGIRDYGNRIGIPTLAGQVFFHPGYTGNCLVNVGCLGIMKKDELIHSRAKAAGNIYVYVGGRTGRDGIHGVTFASAELTEESEEASRSAVQVGDPITKEPVMHVTLECNGKGLLEGLKDFGGGGLSCVCGELAYDAGLGAEIHLDDVPLKEEGLSPWEIWISESQERMMFLVSEENLDEVLHICKQWDVTAVPIGKVIEDQVTRVFFEGSKILDLDLDFFTGGPMYDTCQRPYVLPTIASTVEPSYEMPDVSESLLALLGRINIASKDWVVRQYDHTVRGNTVVPPLQGNINSEGHGDATVLKPLEDSFRGIALTADVNPRYLERDPYWGACCAINEACRNLISVGARPDALLDNLNFGNPEKPERMGELYEACRGLGETAKELRLPFMSGNVSLYNEHKTTSIPPTPEIMAVGIIEDIRKAVTSDLKAQKSKLYLVGQKTESHLGGSEYYEHLGVSGGKVPQPDIQVLKQSMEAMLSAMDDQLVLSAHDVSEGGLAVCLSEMCIGGDIGAKVDVKNVCDLADDVLLFSETPSRWIVEIASDDASEFEETLGKYDVPFVLLGQTGGNRLLVSNGKKKLIDLEVEKMRKVWSSALWNILG